MHRGIFGILVIMILLLALVTACGPSATPTVTPTATTPAPTTPSPTTQAAWQPTRFIDWLVGAGAGGGYDTYSRGIAAVMNKYLGQEVIVKNVPGAGGATQAVQLYRSKPDGYTVGILDLEKRISDSVVKPQDYDVNKFTYLGAVHQYRCCLAVSGKSPWNTIEDVVKASKQKPIRIACQDVGAVEAIFPLIVGMDFQYITAYSGAPESATAVIKGDAEVLIYPDSSELPFLQSKDLKGILYLGPTESEVFKTNGINVPYASGSYAELNALLSTRGVAAPPDLPANIASSLEDSLMKALKDPILLEWSKKTNNPINVIPSKQLGDVFKSQVALYTKYKDVLSKYLK